MPMFKPGTQVGGCRIVRYLATGDVAEVYEVIDATGARRALKIFEREAPLDSAQQHRLALGGEATAMVEHINVVRFIDIGIHHGRVWILLDLVEGSDLRSDLRQLMVGAGGALPVDRAVSLLRQACDGLAAVHKQEIIHRDLKPENLLVTRDDIARVTGFGSARLPGWGMKTTTTQRTSSAYYMAPEYIKHGTVDTKMDVYAMGVILYEAISGKNPIMPGPATLANIIAAQLDVEPPPLGGVPGDLAHLLRWAMVKNPADRCSLRQFIDDLDRVLGRLRAQRRGAARSVPLPNREPGLALTEPAMPAWRSDETNATTPTAASIPAPVPGGTIRMSAAGGPMQGGPDWGAERSASDRLGRDQTRDAVLPPETLRAPSPPAVLTTSRGTEVMAVPSQGPRPPASSVRTEPMPAAPLPVDAISSPADRSSTGAPVEGATRPSRVRRAHPVLALAGVLIVLGLVTAGWLLLGGAQDGPDRTPAPAASPPSPVSAPAASSARPPAAAPSASATPAPSARRRRVGAPQRPK